MARWQRPMMSIESEDDDGPFFGDLSSSLAVPRSFIPSPFFCPHVTAPISAYRRFWRAGTLHASRRTGNPVIADKILSSQELKDGPWRLAILLLTPSVSFVLFVIGCRPFSFSPRRTRLHRQHTHLAGGSEFGEFAFHCHPVLGRIFILNLTNQVSEFFFRYFPLRFTVSLMVPLVFTDCSAVLSGFTGIERVVPEFDD